jgi:hypothetical protein
VNRVLKAGFAVAALAAACAKDPTTIVTEVGTAADVPPLLILRTSIASTSNLERAFTAERSSLEQSDAGDRPGPFRFPLALWLTVDPSLAGPVLVSIQGLDWDTHAVIAEGSGTGEVIEGRETRAIVILSKPITPAP